MPLKIPQLSPPPLSRGVGGISALYTAFRNFLRKSCCCEVSPLRGWFPINTYGGDSNALERRRRQRSEQYFTASQQSAHFLRQVNDRPQTGQTLLGKSALRRWRGMPILLSPLAGLFSWGIAVHHGREPRFSKSVSPRSQPFRAQGFRLIRPPQLSLSNRNGSNLAPR